jgi:hypothetical protein
MAIQIGTGSPAWFTLGWIIALLVFLIAIILIVVGRLDIVVGGLIAGVALSRLL